jgi:hypothetical protein
MDYLRKRRPRLHKRLAEKFVPPPGFTAGGFPGR